MAGPTTAERGERLKSGSGPSRPPRGRLRLPRLSRPPRRLAVLLLTATVLFGAASVWVLYGSSWLRVEHVAVSGTRKLDPDQVRTAAAVPTGAPMISVDTEVIEERLRRALPRIDSVAVIRAWPHGIELAVSERTPALLIEKGGEFIEVDADGVRFATVAQAPKAVPVLKLAAGKSPSLHRFGTTRLVRAAVRVAAQLPAAVARDTRTVEVRSYDAISLELTGDRTVVWGSEERSAEKGRTLSALMKAAPEDRHFDVSVPTAPASSGS